jgi:formate hydrogenlyase subunit 6/NADH:ubiquinone oxidoreductase subunit I
MPLTVLDRFLRPLRGRPVTRPYPAQPLELPAGARGLPELDTDRCDASAACVPACPTGAIAVVEGSWRLDAGRCVFCAACVAACPTDAIGMGHQVELAARSRGALLVVRDIRAGDIRARDVGSAP